ncbi:hypothetical protein BSL78_28903, partial [Apostichopus japonicus]
MVMPDKTFKVQKMNKEIIVGLLVVAVFINAANDKELDGCVSKELFEYKTRSFTHCKFSEDCNSLYWFDNADNSEEAATLIYDWKTKSGEGFTSGEFDIQSNGNLVITNVSFEHEKKFKVICILPNDFFNTYHVDVVVTATPDESYPLISGCEGLPLCLLRTTKDAMIKCIYNGARPMTQLRWLRITGGEEVAIFSSENVTSDSNITFDSKSEVSLSTLGNPTVTLLECSTANNEVHRSNQVLVFLSDGNPLSSSSTSVYFEENKQSKFLCKTFYENTIVWTTEFNQTVAFGTPKGKHVFETFKTDFYLADDGSLIIQFTKFHHEGTYTCHSTDGKVHSTKLTVFVPPTPSYILSEKCPPLGDCVVQSPKESNITCKVPDHRPQVEIEWNTQNHDMIKFTKQSSVANTDSHLFMVTSTLHYELTESISCSNGAVISCNAKGLIKHFFHSSKAIMIKPESCDEDINSSHNVILIVLLASLAVILIAAAIGLYYCFKERRNHEVDISIASPCETRELEELMPRGQEHLAANSSDIRTQFIEDLKITYKQWISLTYNNIWRQNCGYIYVPNEIVVWKVKKMSTTEDGSTHLKNGTELLSYLQKNGQNAILEGETGHGKTSFAIQLVKEWIETSLKETFPIACFLSLKHMNGDDDISTCIVRQLLPTGSRMTNEEVKTMLEKEEKLLIIFDDFEAYSNCSIPSSEVHSLMMKDKMRNAIVILLTRPSESTKTVKGDLVYAQLAKFTTDQVDNYLENVSAVLSNDNVELKTVLQDNALLNHLSSTPIFLSILTLMFSSNENESYVKYNSITEMARGFLSCLELWIDDPRLLVGKAAFQRKKTKFNFEDIKESLGKLAIEELTKKKSSEAEKVVIPSNVLSVFCDCGVLKESPTTAFTHDFYRYLFASWYLSNVSSVTEFYGYMASFDINTSELLLRLTCGLTEKEFHLKKVLDILLCKEDRYPYPLRDCFVRCCRESQLFDANVIKPMLEILCQREQGLQMHGVKDGPDLLEAKAYLINECAKIKIPMKVLSLTQVVEGIEDDMIHFLNDVSCQIPKCVETLSFCDFKDKIKEFHVMHLAERTDKLQQIIIRSAQIPSVCTTHFIDKLHNAKIIVSWATFEAEKLIALSYPSRKHMQWLNHSHVLVLHHLRQTKRWKQLSDAQKDTLEEAVVLEMANSKTFKEFLSSTTNLPDHLRLADYYDIVLELFDNVFNEWHWTYEAKSNAEEELHKKKLQELITEIIKNTGGFVNLEELSRKTKSQDQSLGNGET